MSDNTNNVESPTEADDEEVLRISDRLIEQNREAYEELAQ